jgi:hypothetical protein
MKVTTKKNLPDRMIDRVSSVCHGFVMGSSMRESPAGVLPVPQFVQKLGMLGNRVVVGKPTWYPPRTEALSF